MSIQRDFISIVSKAADKKTKGYDTTAKVIRVEDGIAWVHIPGGVDETPVRKTIAAKAGDTVSIRVYGSRAWITGNESAPPTDDATAVYASTIAIEAGDTASTAGRNATAARAAAGNAKIAADKAKEGVEDLEARADSGEFNGEDAALLKISSSKGILFKSTSFQTELTVAVFVGSKEITTITALRAQFGPGAMLAWKWRKFDDEAFHTIAASDPRLSDDGFTLAITPDDVDEKIVFQCDLIS